MDMIYLARLLRQCWHLPHSTNNDDFLIVWLSRRDRHNHTVVYLEITAEGSNIFAQLQDSKQHYVGVKSPELVSKEMLQFVCDTQESRVIVHLRNEFDAALERESAVDSSLKILEE